MVAYLYATMNVIPKTQNRILEPTGLATPGETRGLMGTGLGLACQESAGRDFGRVMNPTNLFLWSCPGLLAGYPDPLLSLVANMLKSWKKLVAASKNEIQLIPIPHMTP